METNMEKAICYSLKKRYRLRGPSVVPHRLKGLLEVNAFFHQSAQFTCSLLAQKADENFTRCRKYEDFISNFRTSE